MSIDTEKAAEKSQIEPENPSFLPSAPLIEAVRRHRKSYEIEDETLVQMAAILDTLTRKYRKELDRQIEDCRVLKSDILIAELHRAYLEKEMAVAKDHIGRVFGLYREANGERKIMRRWINKLYPGWKRIFDEACRRAANRR